MIKRRIMQGGLGGIRNPSAGKIRAAEDAAGGAANLVAHAERVALQLESNKM
eukprot:gene9113-11526_t